MKSGPKLFIAAASLACLSLRLVAGPPLAATQPVTATSLTSATLNGMAAPSDSNSIAWFQWGTDAGLGESSPPLSLVGGASLVRVSAGISNLVAHQLYHCRLVVSNAAGIALGWDQPFITGGRIVTWDYDGWAQTNVAELDDVVAIADGSRHSLALRADGSVVAWGDSSFANTNLPSAQTNSPVQLTNVLAVAAGANHSLALRNDGTVIGWGENTYGQTNSPASLSNVVAIAGSSDYSLALCSNGMVVAWGANYFGVTNVPASLTNVVAIASGSAHSLALRIDGSVIEWGSVASAPTNVTALSNIVSIAAGDSYSLALKNDGTVVAWGGVSNSSALTVPSEVTNVVSISAGSSHNLALRADGTVVAWSFSNSALTNVPIGLTNVAAIAAGGHSLALGGHGKPIAVPLSLVGVPNHELVITLSGSSFDNSPLTFRLRSLPAEGALYQYASGLRGPIINSPGTVVSDPLGRLIFVPAPDGYGNPYASFSFVASDGRGVSAPATVTIALIGRPFAATQLPTLITLSNATLNGMATPSGLHSTAWFEWGATHGQTTVPLALGIEGSVLRVSAVLSNLAPHQVYHCRLVVSNAAGTALGMDQSFMTGGKVAAWGLVPAPAGLSNLVAIAAGDAHSLALRTDGTVASWGYDYYGETRPPAGLSNVVGIAGGGYHSLALANDGTVTGWGYNNDGQATAPLGLTNVVAVAAGEFHSLALRDDGTLAAWGQSDFVQTNWPPGLSNVVAIAAGQFHNLALRNDGKVFAWGSYGQADVPAGLSNVVAIAAGANHSLALRSDGMLSAWGPDYYGETHLPSGLTNVAGIACGAQLTVALLSDGQVLAWGRNDFGSTNVPAGLNHTVAIAAGLQSLALGGNLAPVATTQTISGAPNHDLLIPLLASDANGDALSLRIMTLPVAGTLYQYANGRGPAINVANSLVTDAAGRIIFAPALDGFGEPYDGFTFAASDGEVVSTSGIVTILLPGLLPSAATQPAIAITSNSAVLAGMATPQHLSSVAWFEYGGSSLYGQTTSAQLLGPGLTGVHWVSAAVTNLLADQVYHFRLVVSNAAGSYAGMDQLFVTGGKAIAWGDNSLGQRAIPATLSNVVSLASGRTHNLALLGNGKVMAWGDNGLGQTAIPAGLTNVIAIWANGNQNLALRSDHSVVAWGSVFYYGAGGVPIQASVPAGLTNVVFMAAGFSHSLALHSDGLVTAWGDWAYGQTPAPPDLSNVVAVAAGLVHSLALKNDGTVTGWGYNVFGQAAVPVGLTNVVAIAAGDFHSLALRRDGSVVGWGVVAYYPVGGGSYYEAATPPPGLSNVVAIAAGSDHALALRRDGSVIAWGRNDHGQTNIPVTIKDGVTLAGGSDHSLALVANRRPWLLTQPRSQTVTAGSGATFAVDAVGTPPLIYQWKFNGTNISGATNATLVISNVQLASAGAYSVVVSNAFGSVASSNALLALNLPPLAQCVDLIVPSGTNCVADASVDHGSIDPEGGPITIFQSPPGPYPIGTNRVILTVTDASGASNSCSALVTVLAMTPEIFCPADIVLTNAHNQSTSLVIFNPVLLNNCSRASVACAPPSGTAFGIGATVVTCSATDEAGNTSQCTFQVLVLPGNQPPAPFIELSPLARFPDWTNLLVIACDNAQAAVIFDASKSFDHDDAFFRVGWFEGTNLFSTNLITTNLLSLGNHEISLRLDDTFPLGTQGAAVTVEVISSAEAVAILMGMVDDSSLPLKDKQPLLALLRQALASFVRGEPIAGIQQLEALDNKIRHQIKPSDSSLGDKLIFAAQLIIEACQIRRQGAN